MSRASVNQEQLVDDLPGRPPSEAAAADDVVADELVSQPLSVRETQRLYRLKAAGFLAVVAADTEDEARTLAATHDALGGDWRNPEFASSEFEDTGEAHVFGDVAISAHAAPTIKRSKRAGEGEEADTRHRFPDPGQPCHCAEGDQPK